jgi:repressor LexA
MEDHKKNVVLVPIIGTVTAGEPILAHENIESSFPMPLNFVDDGNYFMLRIKGDSMIEIGIMDQDYVLVRQQQDAKNGDVIIALLDDSATCKTYYKEKDSIRLQPQNSSLSPIYSKNVQVIGLVKGVYRHM